MGLPAAKFLSSPVDQRRPLVWSKITGEGEENQSGKMQYLQSVILDPKNNKDDAATIAKIDAFWEENRPAEKRKAKSMGYYLNDPLLDADGEKQYDEDDHLVRDPNGKIILTFKTGTTFPDGKQKVVKIFSSKNKVISLGGQIIGNESEGIVSGAMGLYIVKSKQGKIQNAGVTLYLDAIQLKKFVPYEGDDAGFGASDDEDGFTGVDDDGEGFEGEAGRANVRL